MATKNTMTRNQMERKIAEAAKAYTDAPSMETLVEARRQVKAIAYQAMQAGLLDGWTYEDDALKIAGL